MARARTSKPSLSSSSYQELARALVGRKVVGEVARLLADHGIAIIPLKGILLQQLVYPDPSERRISDVDLLVQPADFSTAVAVLSAADYRPVALGRSLIEIALRAPNGVTVDLHRQLFTPYRYQLTTAKVFERSMPDDKLFGTRIALAHPLDTLAHLIGKWVSDHVVGCAATRRKDLELWVEHYELSPNRVVQHLEKVGMARASRYVFQQIAGSSLAFFDEALQLLSPDRVGVMCSELARRLLPLTETSPVAALPAHLLNSSVRRAALSMGAVALRRAAYHYLQNDWGPGPAYSRLPGARSAS